MFTKIMLITLLSTAAPGSDLQSTNSVPPLAPLQVQAEPASGAHAFTISRDTPVELMAYSEISTAEALPGKRFKLLLNQPITVRGTIVAPKGSLAYGEVTSAEESGGLGHSGRMTARLLYLKVGDAEIPLDGQTSAKGTGAGSAGVAILFTGWVGLFHRGNNAKIKAGEIVTGFVAEDVTLDMGSSPTRRISEPTLAPTLQSELGLNSKDLPAPAPSAAPESSPGQGQAALEPAKDRDLPDLSLGLEL